MGVLLARDLALLLVLIALAFWKLVFSRAYTFLEAPDVANQVLPWLQMQAVALRAGTVALWDPYLLGGQPMVGQMQPGVTNPFTYLLLAMPLRDGYLNPVAVHWWFVLLHMIAGVFAYWLCRDLRLHRLAAISGGVFYAIGGYMGHTTWPSYLGGAIWFPLIALYGIRGNPWMTGLFLGLSWMSGHHQVPLFATVAGLGLVAANPSRARLRFAVTALTVAGLVGAVQILPALEYGRHTVRWVDLPDPIGFSGTVPYTVHERNGLSPRDLFHLVQPGAETISNPFAGYVVLGLAAFAVWATFSRAVTRYALGLAVVTLVFALAGASPLHGVLYSLAPMMDKARSPAVALSVTHLALTILAAVGFDALRGRSRWAWALLPLMLLDHSRAVGSDYRRFDDASRINVYPHLEQTRDVAEFLKRQPGPFRVETDYDALLFNFGNWHGVETMAGYLPAVLTTNYRTGWFDDRTRSLYGAAYAVARKPLREGQREVFAGAHGWKVYANPQPRPRAWTVHPGCAGAGEASVVESGVHRVRLQVRMPCPGSVVLAANIYPGWTARVDGRAAEVVAAETALRSVAVEGGAHEVVFEYRPWTVYVGLAGTVVGGLVALWFGRGIFRDRTPLGTVPSLVRR